MTEPDRFATAALLLGAATQLVDGIQAGIAERGFADIRPAHGFAFVRISRGDATMVDVANHLGISKQAASQMVELLVQRGYVDRTQHPTDARSSVLSLTPKGWGCTRAAEQAADRTISEWEKAVGTNEDSSIDVDARIGRLAWTAPPGLVARHAKADSLTRRTGAVSPVLALEDEQSACLELGPVVECRERCLNPDKTRLDLLLTHVFEK